ncbi:MAG: bifunctional riboflavin kinase/FAD synthetase [Armatimonadaceae bacterium]
MSYRYLHKLTESELPPTALAIGVFDGVHRGHQALLVAAGEAAAEFAAVPAALTFDPHPSAIFAPARTPLLLGTLSERAALLHRYGISEVVVAHFDRAFAAQTPDAFISEVLLHRLRVRAVIVGDDFRFGCDRTGNVALLKSAGERHGFAVRVMAPVFVEGTPARSTAIRHLLAGGKVAEAEALLGRPYTLSGTVVRGRQLGRTIGFPTANLQTAPGILIPAAGVYAGYAHLSSGERVRTAISIGTNPTVTPHATERTVEAFLMDDFSRDLYHHSLTLEFAAYLRPTLKFDSLDTLVAQMHQDVALARQLL